MSYEIVLCSVCKKERATVIIDGIGECDVLRERDLGHICLTSGRKRGYMGYIPDNDAEWFCAKCENLPARFFER